MNCRNDGKQKAIRAWDKLKPSDEQIDQMGKVLLHQLATDEWQRGVGIPYASTWLNEQRWKEDPADGPQLRERAAQPPAPEQKEGYGWQ